MVFGAGSELELAGLLQGSGGFLGGQAEVTPTLLQLAQALKGLGVPLSAGGGFQRDDGFALPIRQRVLQKLQETYNNVIYNCYSYSQLLRLFRFLCSLHVNLVAGGGSSLGGFGGYGGLGHGPCA